MKKWFKRKPKVVTMQMGDYLDIHVVTGGVKHLLTLSQINSDIHDGTTVIFTDRTKQYW